ncbi:histone-lysine N-methyltransferase, H3 lysine-9 specific SUVH4-like [Vicia villosa]|uniref:histone-lysine N-methyltransferase, H3 lysine-9 specific SUVH4-like n=1 Tax=Vicia villosa TaxID=3911 RepID=UPI00273AF47C|nr:histone-lysine N-methyltransferase, H3 lysine-9 specific SUVH4-like [Vicia villosa]
MRGILSLRQTFRLFNLHNLAKEETNNKKANAWLVRDSKKEFIQLIFIVLQVVENGIGNELVMGLTTSKYLINKLQTLAKVGIDKVHFMKGQVARAISSSPSLVCNDISDGQEAICIIATNEFDDPPTAPTGFTYIMSNKVSKHVKIPPRTHGCHCQGSCRNINICSCTNFLNGSKFPYTNDNRLIEPRDIVVECGPQCGCGPNCGNKISQKDLNYRLEVYRTVKKGWAVRTWDFIPSGAPVIEYIGVLSRDDKLDNSIINDYIFDIDCLHTINGLDGRNKRIGDVILPKNKSYKKKVSEIEKDPEFCIDAGSFGNVSRFINHSCEPNLFVQCVLSNHLDVRLARLMLFAAHDIPPYQELTYDYGYRLDSVVDSNGKIKQLQCHCGAKKCRKRLY